ncbi:YCII-related domain-containing protein [Nocardia tenerifensis]|uniref:YCII-related domain-containing protein n=1 Tax=Nocardia tenerifensis TaxID=228006 RepID=A0A318L119_9NOCA|nr:YciI family protein [Nocardia tenerifensis]PXX71794.1 YCII-related domain-containing protein [Nocardia tenerifensis]
MKFLLNLYLDAAALPGDGFDHEGFLSAAARTGELISGHVFADPSISAVVRVRDGVVTVTDGPYPQGPDHVAGQYLVDCENRERALELAASIMSERVGGVEVRPLMDSAGMEM